MMWWCHITHRVTDASWPLRPPSPPTMRFLICLLTLQSAALFWNNALSRLKTLHALALALDAAFLKLGVLCTRRWCAFAADALRRMKRCYVIVVLGLREVHLSKAVHKEQRDALLFALTNEVFLCGLFFMLDVVQASALMSQGTQVTKRRCSALIDRSVEACVAELDKVARWEGDEWLAFNAALVSHEGSHTRFYGVPLHNSTRRTEFMSQASDFVARARDELLSRFVNTHPVAKATSFLDFFGWPWHDSVALASHATDCITTIRDHFQPALPPLPCAADQFIQIKMRLLAHMRAGKLPCDLSVTPTPVFTVSALHEVFSQVWCMVLNWDKYVYGDVQCVISVALTALDATAVVERGWSKVNYLKGLGRAHMHASTVDDYLLCQFPAAHPGTVGLPLLLRPPGESMRGARGQRYQCGR